jgi:FtsH-binding integral membrane protein
MSTQTQREYCQNPAASAPLQSRLEFIRKVYSLFFMGILTATIGAFFGTTPNGLPLVFNNILPLIIGYFITFGLLHVFRKSPGLNIGLMLLFCTLSGLLSVPLIMQVLSELPDGPSVIFNAFITTSAVFAGLTCYVFQLKKDISYLGGFLAMAMFGVIAIMITSFFWPPAGSLMAGVGFSIFMILLMGGFILYDTSNIIHKYRTDEHVLAAIALYLDFIILFKYILRLALLRSRD